MCKCFHSVFPRLYQELRFSFVFQVTEAEGASDKQQCDDSALDQGEQVHADKPGLRGLRWSAKRKCQRGIYIFKSYHIKNYSTRLF